MNTKSNVILVVEDEPNIRETLQDLLECSGYEVVTAEDGESGFFKMVKHNPDLIISDLMMPKMDGYQLLEAVRSFGKSKFTPFIILSAKSDTQDIRAGLKTGADDYLLKPFDHKELLESIKYRLSHQDELVQMIKKAETDRMKMDIHDNVQQTVVSLKMNVERILSREGQEEDKLKFDLLNLKKGLEVAFLQIRNLLDGNAAQELMANGFQTTLTKMIDNFKHFTEIGLDFQYSLDEDPPFTSGLELIPIISEILTNIVKHSQATLVKINAFNGVEGIVIGVSDNGVGFDVDNVVKHGGLKNLFYRINKIKGSIDVQSTPGAGAEYRINA